MPNPRGDGGHPLRRDHEDAIIAALRSGGPSSRAELAERVGLSRTTLTGITADLLRRAVIVPVPAAGPRPPGRGRPATRLALNPRAGQLVGLDFGHRRVRIEVVDAAHRRVASTTGHYPAEADWPARVATALALLAELGRRDDVEPAALHGIGVGMPGPFSPRMPAVGDRTDPTPSDYVRHRLRERFEVPVVIDNNTRLAGLAEAVWGGAASDHLIYLRLSDGIGGGLVIGGRLVTGAAGFAGELGHVSVRLDGAGCRCGKRGCLETIASVPAILARCRELGVPVASLGALGAAARKADPLVERVLREAGEALGRVLGSAAITLNPAEIVIGGEIVGLAPQLLDQARTMIDWELQPLSTGRPRIRAAGLGDAAGALGAIAALLRTSPLLVGYPGTTDPTADDHPDDANEDAS